MKRSKFFPWLDLTVILSLTCYVLLDTFVIPRTYAVVATAAAVPTSQATTSTVAAAAGTASVTDTSYSDGSTTITLSTYRVDDTTVYVADVQLSDISALETAFASSTYGKNVTAKTSTIAAASNAVLAINGDYYGARNSGYVIRNGVLYRSTAQSSDQEDLVILSDGSFEIIQEGSVSAQSLLDQGALDVFSFGPALVENGTVSVSENEEVDQAKTTNPRTAIAEISPLHYLFVVADGRTSESTGLSLYQMAQFLQGLGVTTAYNLDGGGSSTMVFNGTVINNPTTNGNTISERKVSDIVYIG